MKSSASIFILCLPFLLQAFDVDTSTSLYRTEAVVTNNKQCIATYGDFIYIASERGLGVYERVDSEIVFRSEIVQQGFVFSHAEVWQDWLFYSFSAGGVSSDTLCRYSLANPANPVLEESVSWWNCGNYFFDNDNMFVGFSTTSQGVRFRVVDPLDFSNEIALFSEPNGLHNLTYLREGLGYSFDTSQQEHSIHVLDISDPTNVQTLYTISGVILNSIWKISLIDSNDRQYMLVSTADPGTTIYDITEHDNPVAIWSHPGYTYNHEIDSNQIAHCCLYDEVVGLDLTALPDARIVYEKPLLYPRDIHQSNGKIITMGAKLEIHEMRNNSLITTAKLEFDGILTHSTYTGRYLNICTRYQSLVQLDLMDPSEQIPAVHFYPTPDTFGGHFQSLAQETLAYTYNVRNEGTWSLEASVFEIESDGDIVNRTQISDNVAGIPHLRSASEMFIYQNSHLCRYDLANSRYNLVENLNIPEPEIGKYYMSFHDDYIYISDDMNGFVVFAPDEGPMELVGEFETPYADVVQFAYFDQYMAISGNFIAEQTQIFSIIDPANPDLVCELDNGGPMAIDYGDNLLFMGIAGCTAYDLTPLLNTGAMPEPVGFIPLSNDGMGYYALPNNRLLAVTRTGVELIDYDPLSATPDEAPSPALALTTYPNPFNPTTTVRFELPAPGRVRVEVFNIRGQRVATLLDEHRGSGAHSVVWDAKSAASGVYFARIRCNGAESVHKLALVR